MTAAGASKLNEFKEWINLMSGNQMREWIDQSKIKIINDSVSISRSISASLINSKNEFNELKKFNSINEFIESNLAEMAEMKQETESAR